ncbi:hypothetical protein BJ912DRAFT_975930 [Pholiota molesta]|nr:hypothetical protein BJ912DRAFT_975930 [Pholiota molesta]
MVTRGDFRLRPSELWPWSSLILNPLAAADMSIAAIMARQSQTLTSTWTLAQCLNYSLFSPYHCLIDFILTLSIAL